MSPKLYLTDLSPPSRAVILTANALNVTLEHKELSLINKEHLSKEFTKINPQHTVPTLDDDGFVIWDSHVITAYLVQKYGKNDCLYPKDLKQRSIVDQRLHFDSGILFPRLRGIMYPIIFLNEKGVPQNKIDDVHEAYKLLEALLSGHEWLALDQLTIADLCAVATVSSLNLVVPIDTTRYPRVTTWKKKCEALPYYTFKKEEIDKYEVLIKKALSS